MSANAPESLAEIVLLRLQRSQDAPFILTVDLQEPYAVQARSYAVMANAAAALADRLQRAGLRQGERVGCYFPNSPAWVAALLGVWWAGGVAAAVGTLLPAPEATKLFAISEVRIVFASADAPDLPDQFEVIRLNDEGRLVDAPPAAGPADPGKYDLPDPDDIAAIFFTSGTTGMPKGVTHTHGDFVSGARRVAAAYARNSDYRPDPAPAHLSPGVAFNPFGHTAGFGRLALRMWIGRPTLLVPRFSIQGVRAVLARFPMDSLQLTPTMLQMLATTGESLDLSGVKYVTSGTAPLPIAVRDSFEARFGVPVMQGYGMTELGVVSQERLEDIRAGRRGPGSVGRIAAGVEVWIRHRDEDKPGEGEVMVRTDEAATEFVGGAVLPIDADGWYATGDIGRIEDDILYITGRAGEKVIVGGFNVYPAEVEDAVRESPFVLDAVVVGLPDDRLGEKPVAGIVWAGKPAEAQLVEYLRGRLAHYKVPRAFFPIPAVPLTAREKVDRRAATDLARQALAQADA